MSALPAGCGGAGAGFGTFFAEAEADGDADAEPLADADSADAADAAALADVGAPLDALPDAAPVAGAADADGAGAGADRSSPSSAGLRQMITAIPQAVTRRSIAMNATSFCIADGPRRRMTIVGVFARRMLTGRSGIRIVICP